MSDDPQLILKNAKATLAALREALKHKEPWDKDVEFHRRDARREYLNLIFQFPYSPQTLSMDNPMWMETSHACIAAYRARIAALDKAIAARNGPAGSRPQGPSPVVEHRKVIQRFRQFLAEEEKFWSAFVLRFARAFALEEAQPHLDALQLTRQSNGNGSSEDEKSTGRNSTFPPESKPLAPPAAQREKKSAVLVKAMISLGDLARYKEQYNERQGRPKAGAEDVPPRWATKGSRKPGESVPRARNYARAHACYMQARMLLPDFGQASHQLAILASYQLDTFGAILHYYRSICVKHPFVMAQENLGKTLAKVHEAHSAQAEESPPKEDEQARKAVDRFKKDVVTLHSYWRSKNISEADLEYHSKYVLSRFDALLSERLLPIGLIVKIYTAALGALWALRMLRKAEAAKESKGASSSEKADSSKTEGTILAHVMHLHISLIKLATVQLDPANLPTTSTPDGLQTATPGPAEQITAVLRRVLQSLRVASRWVTANTDYLYRSANPDKAPAELIRTMGEFWSSYATFATALLAIFGEVEKTKPDAFAGILLEEDVDLDGFAPLKGSLGRRRGKDRSNGHANNQPVNQVHPNDEYILRIWDMFQDAKVLVRSETTPIKRRGDAFISSTDNFTPISEQPPSRLAAPVSVANASHNEPSRDAFIANDDSKENGLDGAEEDVASVSTEDPVSMAMHAALEASDNEYEDGLEEEQILFPQGTWSGLNPGLMQGAHIFPDMRMHEPGVHNFGGTTGRSSALFPPHLAGQLQQQDVFGPIGTSFSTFGGPLLQDHGRQGYYHEAPSPYRSPMASAGQHPVSLQGTQHLFNSTGNPPLVSSPYNGVSSLPYGTTSPHSGVIGLAGSQLMTPQQRLTRLSGGDNAPIGAIRRPSATVTPPKTAQDLLLRVLGTTDATHASSGGHGAPGISNTPTRPYIPTSPTRIDGSPSSPDGHKPAPLLFAPSVGTSIWAP